MAGSAAAIVANDVETPEAEMLHEPELIGGESAEGAGLHRQP
jgi:hypothetical protein